MAARRTYVPALVGLLKGVCFYITRYQSQILLAIGQNNAATLSAVVTACNTLMPLLDAFLNNDQKYPTEANPPA